MLWNKERDVEEWVTRFTVGEDYRWDTLLLPYDIRGSRVQAWGLAQQGLVSQDEHDLLRGALDRLEAEVSRGRISVRPVDEDCHTVIESYLTKELGEVGKKIHTGRSRNDQVLVALRLFTLDYLVRVGALARSIAEVLCTLGKRYERLVMPGYTHMQRAMPTTAGLWALSYAELLAGDLDVLLQARQATSASPLGSAAGYGVPYLDVPRKAQADRLGFNTVQLHAPSVQLSRGKLELQAVHAFVQVGATLNRMASDLVLFNTSEFAFVHLPEALCTGSSIMPQKQNPDVLELVRAGYHRLLAELNVLLTLPANLPSGYHRDLQLTKEAMMRSCLVAVDLADAMERAASGISFDADRAREALTPELHATARALEKVQHGVPFRDAYRQAAEEVGALPSLTEDEILSAYRVEGYPGRGNPAVIRAKLAEHDAWLGR